MWIPDTLFHKEKNSGFIKGDGKPLGPSFTVSPKKLSRSNKKSGQCEYYCRKWQTADYLPFPLLQPHLIIQQPFRDCSCQKYTKPTMSDIQFGNIIRATHYSRTFQRLKASQVAMKSCPQSLINGVGCPWLCFIESLLPRVYLPQTGLKWTWQSHTPWRPLP